MKFQDRLDNSLQYHSAATEKMLLDLIMQTDRHYSAEVALDFMNVHPLTDQRKCSVHLNLYISEVMT